MSICLSVYLSIYLSLHVLVSMSVYFLFGKNELKEAGEMEESEGCEGGNETGRQTNMDGKTNTRRGKRELGKGRRKTDAQDK